MDHLCRHTHCLCDSVAAFASLRCCCACLCAQFSCSATTASVTVKHKTFEEVLIQGNVAGDVGIKLQQLYGIPQQLVKTQKKGK